MIKIYQALLYNYLFLHILTKKMFLNSSLQKKMSMDFIHLI